jgi:hypothetical protein
MQISVLWQQPIDLYDGSDSSQNYIYTCDDLNCVPEDAGVYIFARRFAEILYPLYVGQAGSLRYRVRQQLNNVRLMRGVQNAKIGARVLLVGVLDLKGGQKTATALNLAERALIEQFLNAQHELLNKQGTRIRADEILSSGNRESCRLTSPSIVIPRR